MIQSILASGRRILTVLLALAALLAFGYAGSWVRGLFPGLPNTVVLSHGKRVIRLQEIKEVTRWKTKTVQIPVEVMVPAAALPTKPGAAITAKAEKASEKAQAKVEKLFAGAIDLGANWLLATGEIPPSERGFKLAATIPKDGGKVTLTAVENDPCLFCFGGDKRLWIGPGVRVMSIPGQGMQAEPIIAVSGFADALRMGSWRYSGHVDAAWGQRLGGEVRIYAGIGKKWSN